MEMFTLAKLGKDDPMLLEHDFSTWFGSNVSERFFLMHVGIPKTSQWKI